jgi:hypothetical protein
MPSLKIISLLSFCGYLLVGCSSHGENQDAAFEQEKLRQEITGDSTYYGDSNAQAAGLNALKTTKGNLPIRTGGTPKNTIALDEWAQFKLDIGQRIAHNATKIQSILVASGPDAKLAKKLVALEKNNNAIQVEMAQYDGKLKPKWEKFKSGIDLGLFSIETELKELAR